MKELITNINKLKKANSIAGFKISFEDEGATREDLIKFRIATNECDLPLYVKIGGCEAKTDIFTCKNYIVDGVVSPMIESVFAVEKFVNCCSEVNYLENKFINVETKTCVNNLDEILNSPAAKSLDGFTIGRSDLAASYGLTKKSVDSKQIYDVVESSFKKIKDYGFLATMGGNITSHSKDFVTNLYKKGLLDKIETRNIIMKLNDDNVKSLETIINDALFLETLIMKERRDRTEIYFNRNVKRLNDINGRIK